jgi:hypothetical protein
VIWWSEFLARDLKVRVRFPALPDFLRSSGSAGVHTSLRSTTEELRERKSSGSGLDSREYSRRDPSRWPRGTLYQQKLALTSRTSGGRSVGIVRSRTQATEFSLVSFLLYAKWMNNICNNIWTHTHTHARTYVGSIVRDIMFLEYRKIRLWQSNLSAAVS